jgi:hypothetical protein
VKICAFVCLIVKFGFGIKWVIVGGWLIFDFEKKLWWVDFR